MDCDLCLKKIWRDTELWEGEIQGPLYRVYIKFIYYQH